MRASRRSPRRRTSTLFAKIQAPRCSVDSWAVSSSFWADSASMLYGGTYRSIVCSLPWTVPSHTSRTPQRPGFRTCTTRSTRTPPASGSTGVTRAMNVGELAAQDSSTFSPRPSQVSVRVSPFRLSVATPARLVCRLAPPTSPLLPPSLPLSWLTARCPTGLRMAHPSLPSTATVSPSR